MPEIPRPGQIFEPHLFPSNFFLCPTFRCPETSGLDFILHVSTTKWHHQMMHPREIYGDRTWASSLVARLTTNGERPQTHARCAEHDGPNATTSGHVHSAKRLDQNVSAHRWKYLTLMPRHCASWREWMTLSRTLWDFLHVSETLLRKVHHHPLPHLILQGSCRPAGIR